MSLFKFLFRRRRKRALAAQPFVENEKQFRERIELLTVMALLMQRP